MKLYYLSIPLGCALACFGGVLYLQAKEAQQPFRTKTRHDVTQKLEGIATKMDTRQAPDFSETDSEGNKFELKQTLKKGPVFVYFIMDECPCSADVEPLFHHLYKQFDGKLQFVGVINTKVDKAKAWKNEFEIPYPVLPDADLKIIKSYEATNSAFSALISQDGKILKMWPGYCTSYLQEMNQMMASQLGEKPKPFDTQYAPLKKSAGCSFYVKSTSPDL